MTLTARLLAILKEPERYAASVSEPWNVIDYKDGHEASQSNRAEAKATAADLNARHRLASILRMIAEELAKEAELISNSTHCGSENDELRAATQGWRTMHTARKFILSIMPEEK